MKVIIGAGSTKQEGWISTQEADLDVTSSESFQSFFKDKRAKAMLAEHVWEHLSYQEGVKAACLCYEYLEWGGYIRVAVPDGNLRDEAFLKLVGIGGPGPAASHKVLYTYHELIAVFEAAGFTVSVLEYCDDQGHFHYRYWNPEDGKVGRSFRYDTRNSTNKIGMASIIIDAHKVLRV